MTAMSDLQTPKTSQTSRENRGDTKLATGASLVCREVSLKNSGKVLMQSRRNCRGDERARSFFVKKTEGLYIPEPGN